MSSPRRLSLPRARRIALAAQGFARPRPERVDAGHIRRLIERIAVLQIDSVNVLSRSHYLPVFARLGVYDTALLDRLTGKKPRLLTEYWAHEAAYVEPALARHFGFRARGFAAREQDPALEPLKEAVRAELSSGPATARGLDERIEHDLPERERDHWGWNPSYTKSAAERLFASQEIFSAGRTPSFERRYALADDVHPDLRREFTPDDEAFDALLARAARALGVGSLDCFRDYFRLPAAPTARAIARAEEAGTLEPVEIEGFGAAAWRWHEAREPRRVAARALLSPFDSLVFNRRRNLRLFDFHYRIEIYTPAPKRRYGYYVLPFLLDEAIAARVDLKADRQASTLRVLASWAEPGAPGHTAAELAAELWEMADWLGLARVHIAPRGDLAARLEVEALNSRG